MKGVAIEPGVMVACVCKVCGAEFMHERQPHVQGRNPTRCVPHRPSARQLARVEYLSHRVTPGRANFRRAVAALRASPSPEGYLHMAALCMAAARMLGGEA